MVKKSQKSYNNLLSWIDFFQMVMVVMIMFFALQSLRVTAALKDGLQPRAEFIATLDWPRELNSDMDLWMETSDKVIINFKNRETGNVHLDRDTRGHMNDMVVLEDGTKVQPATHREIITIRSIVPGVYTIIVHQYKSWDEKGNEIGYGKVFPVKTRLEISKINPKVTTVFAEDITVEKIFQGVEAVRFEVTKDGRFKKLDKSGEDIISKYIGRDLGVRNP